MEVICSECGAHVVRSSANAKTCSQSCYRLRENRQIRERYAASPARRAYNVIKCREYQRQMREQARQWRAEHGA
jgi:endogenous inhibitor of DNA gyrase (YacG/DUF329 family)